jgi:hypothetical protein
MAVFRPNTPVVVNTPTVSVDVDPRAPLPRGRQRFSLVVVDDSGNESIADEIVVIVTDQGKPTAVLSGPSTVAEGASFTLSGARSFDVGGGRIAEYRFTYLGPVL